MDDDAEQTVESIRNRAEIVFGNGLTGAGIALRVRSSAAYAIVDENQATFFEGLSAYAGTTYTVEVWNLGAQQVVGSDCKSVPLYEMIRPFYRCTGYAPYAGVLVAGVAGANQCVTAAEAFMLASYAIEESVQNTRDVYFDGDVLAQMALEGHTWVDEGTDTKAEVTKHRGRRQRGDGDELGRTSARATRSAPACASAFQPVSSSAVHRTAHPRALPSPTGGRALRREPASLPASICTTPCFPARSLRIHAPVPGPLTGGPGQPLWRGGDGSPSERRRPCLVRFHAHLIWMAQGRRCLVSDGRFAAPTELAAALGPRRSEKNRAKRVHK